MSSSLFLRAFLIFDVFIMGAIAAVAFRHAMAHFRPAKHDAEPGSTKPAGGHLPPAMREKMLEEAQANFEVVLKTTTRDLRSDLKATAEELKQHIEKISAEAANTELERYKAVVAEMATAAKGDAKNLDNQKTQLKAKMAAEIAEEKKILLAQIDTKLADAVSSFLMETLQHEVDLGAQGPYLTKLLEEHKADFAKEVGDGQG